MNLTKKQKSILSSHYEPGVGDIFISISDKEYREIHIYLEENGKWFTGNMELFPYLESLAKEIRKE